MPALGSGSGSSRSPPAPRTARSTAPRSVPPPPLHRPRREGLPPHTRGPATRRRPARERLRRGFRFAFSRGRLHQISHEELPNELRTGVFIWYIPASESQEGDEANDQDRQDHADQP